MKNVRIQIYQSVPGDSGNQRKLMQTLMIEVDSNKLLTAKRVSQILKRELPRFLCAGSVTVIKTEEGWEATRSMEPSKNCSFHYSWEYAVVSEWSK